jgi:hypothetical protein
MGDAGRLALLAGLLCAVSEAAWGQEFLPVSYPPRDILLVGAIPSAQFFNQFGSGSPYTLFTNLSLVPWNAATSGNLSIGVIFEEFQQSDFLQWNSAQDNWGTASAPRALGGVHCARAQNVGGSMARSAGSTSSASIVLNTTDPALQRHPLTCGFSSPFLYSTDPASLYDTLCPACRGTLRVVGQPPAATPVVLLEHGNADGDGTEWKGRRALGPLRDTDKPPNRLRGRFLMARMFHWASDLNDAPTISVNSNVLLDSFTLTEKNVSNSINVSSLLSQVGYADGDAGMGYCVYPGIAVLSISSPAKTSWQYFAQGTWKNFDSDLSPSSAFTLSGSHAIRLTGDAAAAGTALLSFAAWDGTTVSAPDGDAVLTRLDVSSRRGGEYATSTATALLRVTILATLATAGSGPTPVTTGPMAGGTVSLTSGVATTTGNGIVTTTGNRGATVASTTRSDVAASSTNPSDASTAVIAIIAVVVSVVVCVGLAVAWLFWRRRQHQSSDNELSSRSESASSMPADGGSYHNIESVSGGGDAAYHNVQDIKKKVKKGADRGAGSSQYQSVDDLMRNQSDVSDVTLDTPSANYDVLPVRSDGSGGLVETP